MCVFSALPIAIGIVVSAVCVKFKSWKFVNLMIDILKQLSLSMQKGVFIIAMLMCFLQCSFSNEQQIKPIDETGNSFRVIAFYKGDGLDIEQYDLSKLTHLIFCFTYLDGNKMTIKNEADKVQLSRFVALKNKYPKLTLNC